MQCNGNLKDFKRISHLGPSWILKAQPETGKSLHMPPDLCSSEKWDIWESGRRHKLLPCFIWTTAFTTVTQWMTAATTNVCFPVRPSNNDHPWQTVPSQPRFSFCPHPSFELLHPCGCSHALSSHCCATTFLPDQFLTQMSTDEAEETRACGWNMAAITNRKTSGKGGPCKLTTTARQWKRWWAPRGWSTSWEWAS